MRCPVLGCRSNSPVAGGTGIGIALVLDVQAAIVAIEVAIRLHRAPKIERTGIFTCYSELDVGGRVDGPGERAVAHQWWVYREVATDIATGLLLDRKSHVCGAVVCRIIKCAVVIAGQMWVGVGGRRGRW